ncbi:hypothetical protein LY78DRAFT_403215 [Colletotrichum sublineola]|nr:hypothetical protein LY78DRAFT_403215 [Colletotrichum sublineola]
MLWGGNALTAHLMMGHRCAGGNRLEVSMPDLFQDSDQVIVACGEMRRPVTFRSCLSRSYGDRLKYAFKQHESRWFRSLMPRAGSAYSMEERDNKPTREATVAQPKHIQLGHFLIISRDPGSQAFCFPSHERVEIGVNTSFGWEQTCITESDGCPGAVGASKG